MVVLIMLPLLMFNIQPTKAESPTSPITLIPQEYIIKYAKEFNTSPDVLLAVAKCESNFKPNAIHYNDGGKGKHSVGIFQFQESTFNTWEDILGEDLDYYSYADQSKLAAFMVSEGQLRQWSCARIIGVVK